MGTTKKFRIKSQKLMIRSVWQKLSITWHHIALTWPEGKVVNHLNKFLGSLHCVCRFLGKGGSISYTLANQTVQNDSLKRSMRKRDYSKFDSLFPAKSMMYPTSPSWPLSFVFPHRDFLRLGAFSFLRHASIVAASSTRPPWRSEKQVPSPGVRKPHLGYGQEAWKYGTKSTMLT